MQMDGREDFYVIVRPRNDRKSWEAFSSELPWMEVGNSGVLVGVTVVAETAHEAVRNLYKAVKSKKPVVYFWNANGLGLHYPEDLGE